MEDKKIISIEDRIPKLKKQRKKKANRRLVFYLSLFFVLISIIIYLQSPLSYIKNIHVYGHHVLHENEIIELSDIKNDTNIWKAKDRKSIRLNSSHVAISYAVFCLKKKIM